MTGTITKNYIAHECITCGIDWYMSSTFDDKRKGDKNPFFCPNGHSQIYSKSTEEYLKETIAEKERKIARIIELVPKKLRKDI